ncbi:NUDIX hydrolase [Candidatus Halobonum tyrrellensis]|uniref:ADP-ribose pyrophosphatase n=1 Tax=Candidatus Halobonum tyrrellensis G22 TaxID=1324957 RepID=V4J1N6_9EURY|nr:NUDIX domain-containing protein [Candidatus Halobonum tyrrellensis]ESP89322.1 ADP-ribose pyrophosphatase [Candidatus Halobonum tyrrellensis G22]
MISEGSRGAVADALDRLRDEWGRFPVKRTAREVDPESWDRDRERFDAGTVGAAGAWVRRDDGRALVVRRDDETGWSEPGGEQASGEPLTRTAVRETREETGVDAALTGVLTARRVVESAPSRPSLHRLVVVFEAAYDRGDPRPRGDGTDAVRWVADRPDDVPYPAVGAYPP